MDKEVVFARIDGKKEVYDPLVHWVEKPWVQAYQVAIISQERWEWILTHPDPKEAVEKYFPQI